MKISIITVAYNSEQTIARTIESICAQTYLTHKECQLEYLIIDGNSSDNTMAVAESYRDRLEKKGVSYIVVSEPDRGIYDAMNKGIRLATGDVIGIINSNDRYDKEALDTVTETFEDTGCELMYADIRVHRENGSAFVKKARLRSFETSRDWNHPTTFVRADIYKENPFRELGIHDDYGFFLQMKKQNRKIVIVNKVLADFEMGGASNSKSLKAAKKRIKDRYLYCYRINGFSRLYIIECIAIEAAKWILG
jgi:glycosyltransferase involved in cell wall biosynthesis